MPPRNVIVILLVSITSIACYLKAERSRYTAQLGEAMQLIENLYVEDVDSRELFENAMEGMASGLDQYSQYIGPEGFTQMEQVLDQEFGGVGIEVEKASEEKPIVVLSPLVGSPGYKAGLRAGDQILAIDGVSTIGLKQQEAVPKMRGKPGTSVKLEVRHSGEKESFELVIVRDVIKVDSLLGDTRRPDGTWNYHLEEDPRIAYLRLTTFGQHSAEEIRKVLTQSGATPFGGVILDLRNNAGGLLDAAVETCDLFLEGGTIVTTRGRKGELRSLHQATNSTILPPEVPLVVLINGFSASASEIVAACLQDHGRATVVGQRSWGKGTVQNLLELEGGRSALKLTTASYWRPSNKNIHRSKDEPETAEWGVMPNAGFEVKLTDEEFEKVFVARRQRDLNRAPEGDAEAPMDDPQLRKAIELLQKKLGGNRPTTSLTSAKG